MTETRTYAEWNAAARQAAVSDGLPVYPAESAVVERLLEASDLSPDTVLGTVAPALLPASVEAVAVQAAAAGCPSSAFPVVIAAVRAVLDETVDAVGPGFNLEGVQATACSCAPLVIVSPARAAAIGMQYRHSVLSSSSAVNAAIGRALRLVLWNIGGGRPGVTDMSVIGNPAKFGWSLAEHPDSPWAPLHVARGLTRAPDAVTVFACDSPHEVALPDLRDGATVDPLLLAGSIAATVRQAGSLNMYWGGQALVVVNLTMARLFADRGWGRADLAGCLYEFARRSPAECLEFYDPGMMQFFDRPAWSEPLGAVPAVSDPRDFHIVVSGEGAAPAVAVCPGWGAAGGHAMTVALPPRPSAASAPPTLVTTTAPMSEPVVLDADPVVVGAVSGDALGERIPIRRAPRGSSHPLRVLLFANYAQPDGSPGGIMRWLEDELGKREDVSAVGWYPSPLPTAREPIAVLEDLAAKYDAVILGVGLSGSRSWKMAIDAVHFEQVGLPSVTLVARGYEGYIFSLAGTAGYIDELSVVLIEPTDPPLETGHSAEILEQLLASVVDDGRTSGPLGGAAS